MNTLITLNTINFTILQSIQRYDLKKCREHIILGGYY